MLSFRSNIKMTGMRNTLLLLFIFAFCKTFSQEIPAITLADSSQLKLSSLKIESKIVDNFAVTTYDMKFYNGLNRILEGELVFPLGEGQSVSGFAMDVNGKLRDAVIVEKELARVAFENTVRQNIDPGLLEKTEGNNYKARIYPILPNAYKRVVVTYEQELYAIKDFRTYEVPLDFKEVLDNFSIEVDVFGGKDAPVLKNTQFKNDLYFKKLDNKYTAQLERKNYKPSTPLVLQIPNKTQYQKVLVNNNYFYVYQGLESDFRLKKRPKKITILWDASFSSQYKKIDKELALIDSYVAYLKDVKIEIISFNNSVDKTETFNITHGDWSALKKFINAIKYDGGTSLAIFNDSKIIADEVLLFSDGLINLGNFNGKFKKSIYTINSSVSANHEALNAIATHSGGAYINLLRYNVADASSALRRETFQFLGVKHNKNVHEVYPQKNTNVTSDFSITGKFSKETTLQLLFGYNNKVTKRIDVAIKESQKTKIVTKLWAKQKLKSLNKNKEENKKAIIALAQKHSMITDYTSMLILDRIEDYVKYRIEPPQELKKEYKERLIDLDQEEAYKEEELKERREDVFEEYKELRDWYATIYPKKKPRRKKEIQPNPTTTPIDENTNTNLGSIPLDTTTTTTTQSANAVTVDPNIHNYVMNSTEIMVQGTITPIDPINRAISGVITDNTGAPFPGVNIIVKGTVRGTNTDFDGNFTILVEKGEVLSFSYVGYRTKTLQIGNANTVNVVLEEDTAMLEEIVVTGYASQSKSYVMASVVSVQSESFEETMAGVSGSPSSSVKIRGGHRLQIQNLFM